MWFTPNKGVFTVLVSGLAIWNGFVTVSAQDSMCKLTQVNATKPTPSLTQCYKHNTKACCVLGHDEAIKEEYRTLLSTPCFREFELLEHYFCIGCHPLQHRFVTSTGSNPVLRICETFAEAIFQERLESCGLNLPVINLDATEDNPAAVWNFNYELSPSTEIPRFRQVVLPKFVFRNATQFLNAMKPPFFEAYEIVVVSDDTEDALCFSCAFVSRVGQVSSAVCVFLLFLVLS